MSNNRKFRLFIGYDYDKNPIGALLSDSEEKAWIAWQAMKDSPHSIEEIKPNSMVSHTGLIFLLTSTEHEHYGSKSFKYREWKRGL